MLVELLLHSKELRIEQRRLLLDVALSSSRRGGGRRGLGGRLRLVVGLNEMHEGGQRHRRRTTKFGQILDRERMGGIVFERRPRGRFVVPGGVEEETDGKPRLRTDFARSDEPIHLVIAQRHLSLGVRSDVALALHHMECGRLWKRMLRGLRQHAHAR